MKPCTFQPVHGKTDLSSAHEQANHAGVTQSIDVRVVFERNHRFLYEIFYPNTAYIVPYFWMPKFVKATDASARTLALYNDPA